MALVQTTTGVVAANSLTVLGTLGLNTIAGNAIIVLAGVNASKNQSTILSGVSDSSGNSYKLAVSSTINSTVLKGIDIWYANNIVGGSVIVTGTNVSSVPSSLIIREYSGIDRASPLDVVGSNIGTATGTNLNLGTSLISTAPNALVVGGAATSAGIQTAGGGFGNIVIGTSSSSQTASQDKTISAIGVQTGTMFNSTLAQWAGALATFKQTGAQAQLIQSSGTSGLGLTALSASWGGATTTGNMVVVGVTITNAATLGTVTSVTDTQGNAYTKAISQAGTAVKVLDTELWYATNITGGAGSVTVNLPLNAVSMYAREYSGGYNYLDVTSSAVGSSTTLNSGTTAAISQANELLIIASGDEQGGAQTYQAAGNFGDMVGTTTTATGLCMSDQIVNTGGAQTGTNTMTTADEWVSVMATFRRIANPRYTPQGGGL